MEQFKQILVTLMFALFIVPAISQIKSPAKSQNNHPVSNSQFSEFKHLAARANLSFIFPDGFKEIKAPNNEYFSFDYAMELPGKDFEIWLHIKPEKEDWASYIHSLTKPNAQLANPDSLYKGMGTAQAIALAGDKNYFERVLPPDVLVRYNADAGRSYLLTLPDMPETRHYKYALLITLQKNHTGTLLAVCFTNEKGPEFFKNMSKASNCLKFKTSTQ